MPQIMDFDPRSGTLRQESDLLAGPGVAIRGTITGPDGKPVGGVSIVLETVIGKQQGGRFSTLQWTMTDDHGRYALAGIPRGLTLSGLMVYAEPPDNRSFMTVVPSGRFQGRPYAQGMMFDNLDRDQDPLDFALKVETPEPLVPHGLRDRRRGDHPRDRPPWR